MTVKEQHVRTDASMGDTAVEVFITKERTLRGLLLYSILGRFEANVVGGCTYQPTSDT